MATVRPIDSLAPIQTLQPNSDTIEGTPLNQLLINEGQSEGGRFIGGDGSLLLERYQLSSRDV